MATARISTCAFGLGFVLALSGCVAPRALGQGVLPQPRDVIGHAVGADYKLARWAKIVEYFDKLGAASERVNVRRIGTTTEGKPFLLAEISSAETIRSLDRYRTFQHKLADPRLIKDDADRDDVLAHAKPTVIVTCSLHSSEVAAAQMSMELAYDLASSDDPQTREILDHTILLLVPCANPDGLDKVKEWYDRWLDTPFEAGPMPWIYQKYAGHDNNRDWFMLNLVETRIVTKLLYHEWFPTISYDVHQMGNRGARFFVPPFFDPVNPNVDPLIHQSLLIIGGHMAAELQQARKTGVIFKAIYDNWWQGGNRTTPYRHNVVGILTEAASAKIASPVFQEYRQLRGGSRGMPNYSPTVNFPEPWPGGWWRLRDIVDYELIANKALLRLAARYRDDFVHNQLALGEKALRLGREQPPFAWLVPPGQRDPAAAEHMLEILKLGGIEVERAKGAFNADGVEYPAGTFVMLAEQPYRAHLKDMMERQVYPDRRTYPGGPAEPPYDVAGWTLPLQMGVKSVEVVSKFTASLERAADFAFAAPAPLEKRAVAWGTNRFSNQDYVACNRALAAGIEASVLTQPHEGLPIGSILFKAENTNAAQLAGFGFDHLTPMKTLPEAMPEPIGSFVVPLAKPRTALYQPWTASMDEGWTRFVLEEFEFPYTTLHNAEIRAGNLRERFDCIIVPDLSLSSLLSGVSDKRMPAPYAGGIGPDGAMQLERFVAAGGTLALMDSATELATDLLRVPVRNVLAGLENDKFFCPGSILRIRVNNTHPLGYGFDNEAAAYFARSQAFVTGEEALKARGHEGTQARSGGSRAAAPSGNREGARAGARKGAREGARAGAREGEAPAEPLSSPSDADIERKLADYPVTTVARYSDDITLLSGYLLGQDYIRNKAAICEVSHGGGRIVLLGFRVQYRGQPWGTFKFLFNAIYRSTLGD